MGDALKVLPGAPTSISGDPLPESVKNALPSNLAKRAFEYGSVLADEVKSDSIPRHELDFAVSALHIRDVPLGGFGNAGYGAHDGP